MCACVWMKCLPLEVASTWEFIACLCLKRNLFDPQSFAWWWWLGRVLYSHENRLLRGDTTLSTRGGGRNVQPSDATSSDLDYAPLIRCFCARHEAQDATFAAGGRKTDQNRVEQHRLYYLLDAVVSLPHFCTEQLTAYHSVPRYRHRVVQQLVPNPCL